MRVFFLVTAWTLMVVGCPGCSTNPATGRTQINILSQNREITLSRQAQAGFVDSYGGQIPSPQIQQYVASIGQRLAAVSERPGLPWAFRVVDSSVVNAFALPGGQVFVTRGLLAKLDNEAQLAGVLGHEIGHVTAQHIGQQMTQQLLLQTAVIGVNLATEHSDHDWLRVLGIGAQAGGAVYLLKFGRDQEIEADTLGLRYMARVGYSPIGQLQVMQILEESSSQQTNQPKILLTHPLPETRRRHLEKHIREYYPDHQDPSHYRFNFDAFQAAVLDPIKTLDPPAAPVMVSHESL